MGPTVATLILCGDLSSTDVNAVGHAMFDGWDSAVTPVPAPTVSSTEGPRRIVLVDRPGSVQSMVFAGHDAPSRSTPDYVPMTTMSLALGGMFSSRLNLKLREEKGYTYGAFGSFDCRRDGGVFAARAAVQTAVTGAAVTDLLAELDAMHEGGLTSDELERARSYRAGIFPVNFAGPGSVASGLGDIVIHGHPDDHFDRLRADIQATTLEEVNATTRTRLKPNETVVVVVGDASAVQGDLTGLPLEVVSDED
jgi:predicted Zn-dependent peptidase